MSQIYESYTMPDGSTATICAYRSPKGVFGAKLELSNGKTLPMSIGGTPSKPVRSLTAAMEGAKKFLRGVYGASTTHHLTKRAARRPRFDPTPSQLARLTSAQNRHAARVKTNAHLGKKKTERRITHRLQLTPSELRAVEMARGHYAWADMLSAHASENGAVAFTESEMWQWTDDVDSDTEGGHSPFPMASGSLAGKLQSFYDERV